MTGPEHYKEAERLLGFAEMVASLEQRNAAQGRAQVHATLALAAATALSSRQSDVNNPPSMALDDQAGWDAVCKEVAW